MNINPMNVEPVIRQVWSSDTLKLVYIAGYSVGSPRPREGLLSSILFSETEYLVDVAQPS
jgi:hypothetical protein